MRLLVCGSRTWSTEEQYHCVADEIEALAPSLVMHGGAKGADECADMWCRTPPDEIPLLVFRANWNADGKAAGPIRDARMLADGKPDRGLAFGPLWKRETPIGLSGIPYRRTGTGDMVSKMLRAGLPVRWVAAPGVDAVDLVTMPEPT